MKRHLPFIIVAVVAIAALGSGAMLYRAQLPNNRTPEGVRRLVEEAVKAEISASEKK
jgi:hypothetical protein